MISATQPVEYQPTCARATTFDEINNCLEMLYNRVNQQTLYLRDMANTAMGHIPETTSTRVGGKGPESFPTTRAHLDQLVTAIEELETTISRFFV